MKNTKVFFAMTSENITFLFPCNEPKEALKKMEIWDNKSNPGFNLVALIDTVEDKTTFTYLLGELTERMSSIKMMSIYMKMENLKKVNLNGVCRTSVMQEKTITFMNDESHKYPHPHSNVLLNFSTFLGLSITNEPGQKLPYQEVTSEEVNVY